MMSRWSCRVEVDRDDEEPMRCHGFLILLSMHVIWMYNTETATASVG